MHMTFMYFFFPLFCFLSCLFFCVDGQKNGYWLKCSNFELISIVLRPTYLDKERSNINIQSVHQSVKLLWSILNVCKGSYHGIEPNWGHLGIGRLALFMFADCACPDKRISPWFTFRASDHVRDVLGRDQFCYSDFCALSLWQTLLSFPARIEK